ncbi:MAG: adenylate cyclase [Oscillospiraceae bacterium]|nr:adenylate cyclase [Oscillospiraceae bacterium]
MKQIYTTTLRLNLFDEDDRRAFEYLQCMDKKKYRSYSKAIVTAINEHFERQKRLAADPYLETREKEDAFLKRITETIENSLRFAQPAVPTKATNTDTEELSVALDFADSF